MQGMSGLTNIVYNLEKKQWEIISVVEKNQTTRCQFHQHFTRAFCANIFAPKNYNAKPNQRKAAQFAFVQKFTGKMLMKLTTDLFLEFLMDQKSFQWEFGDGF